MRTGVCVCVRARDGWMVGYSVCGNIIVQTKVNGVSLVVHTRRRVRSRGQGGQRNGGDVERTSAWAWRLDSTSFCIACDDRSGITQLLAWQSISLAH